MKPSLVAPDRAHRSQLTPESTPRTVYMKKMIGHWGSRPIPRFRRNAILKIGVLIQHRNRHKAESRTLKWLIQLTFMAPRLEELIFQTAESVEDYDNPRWLEMKLVQCAKQLTDWPSTQLTDQSRPVAADGAPNARGNDDSFSQDRNEAISAELPLENPLFMLSAAATMSDSPTAVIPPHVAPSVGSSRPPLGSSSRPPLASRSGHPKSEQHNRVLNSNWIELVVDLFSCNQP